MPSQSPAIAPLTPADLPDALALVRECGWNQVEADWDVFLSEGAAFRVGTPQGEIAATAAILPYRPFGWISMVLVGAGHRRRGLATQLLQRCIAELRERGLVPMLDATPAGREVYRQLGFHDGWAITRWRRTAPASQWLPAGEDGVAPLQDEHWAELAALDAQAFGADRLPLLRALAARCRDFACVARADGRVTGFLLGRDGRLATQVGPLVAQDAATAQALLAHALRRIDAPVLLDVLDRHCDFSALLPRCGFAVERGYTRMALGADRAFGDDARMVAIAGPELG
ncbi:MAG TPA: GNAT family N-acetyltransferase [Ramlibacter sp.]|jgi:GNAT superfamily N-acetyltransferase|nr:GNAT family N-acetyltransferase [Ramlibacter sp.]